MIKLKLVSLPKAVQFKSKISLPNVTLANFQEKRVIPTKELQEIKADQGFDGLSKVNVEPIPDKYGDIAEYFQETINLTKNVELKYFIKKIPFIDVSKLTSMANFFQNMVLVEELPILDTSNVTYMSYICRGCSLLKEVPKWNYEKVKYLTQAFDSTSITELDIYCPNVIQLNYLCQGCSKLKQVKNLTTSVATTVYKMFAECNLLEEICELDLSTVNMVNDCFYKNYNLQMIHGLKNLGKAYTQKTTHYTDYKLDLGYSSKLTHESISNVINGLYDLNLSYNVADGGTLYRQEVRFSNKVKNLITEEELKLANDKGWDVTYY